MRKSPGLKPVIVVGEGDKSQFTELNQNELSSGLRCSHRNTFAPFQFRLCF